MRSFLRSPGVMNAQIWYSHNGAVKHRAGDHGHLEPGGEAVQHAVVDQHALRRSSRVKRYFAGTEQYGCLRKCRIGV